MKSAIELAAMSEVRAIAKEGYIYGFPLVDNYRIMHSRFVDREHPEFKAPWNQICNNGRVYTSEDKAIQTPNSDTPYSQLGADLRSEPLVLTMPAVEKSRYYSAQFIDMYTFNFAYVGTRATGNHPGSFLLAGPNWRGFKPEGVRRMIRCETEFALVLYRTQLFRPDDIEKVRKIQSGYRVQSLSAFLGRLPPAPPPAITFVKPLDAEQLRTSPEFFNILDFVLQYCPRHPSDEALRGRLARLGIGTSGTFDAQNCSPGLRGAIEDGIADAWRAIDDVAKGIAGGTVPVDALFGTREHLKNNHACRMAGAVRSIHGNSKEEAFYHMYALDFDGHGLDTANHRYTLRFAPGRLPPVNAFWSVTLYELPAQHLSANPLNRYLINSPMLPELKRDYDGGLTIHIQHPSPGQDRESNWLPAPRSLIKIALRLYSPKPEVSTGEWRVPPILRQI